MSPGISKLEELITQEVANIMGPLKVRNQDGFYSKLAKSMWALDTSLEKHYEDDIAPNKRRTVWEAIYSNQAIVDMIKNSHTFITMEITHVLEGLLDDEDGLYERITACLFHGQDLTKLLESMDASPKEIRVVSEKFSNNFVLGGCLLRPKPMPNIEHFTSLLHIQFAHPPVLSVTVSSSSTSTTQQDLDDFTLVEHQQQQVPLMAGIPTAPPLPPANPTLLKVSNAPPRPKTPPPRSSKAPPPPTCARPSSVPVHKILPPSAPSLLQLPIYTPSQTSPPSPENPPLYPPIPQQNLPPPLPPVSRPPQTAPPQIPTTIAQGNVCPQLRARHQTSLPKHAAKAQPGKGDTPKRSFFQKLVGKGGEPNVHEFTVSEPHGFRHESHMGWNSDNGFESRNMPAEWKSVFPAADNKKK